MAGGVTWTWRQKKGGSTRTFQKAPLTELEQRLKGQSLTITDIQRSSRKTFSPGLYDLTELQRDANLRFGFSAKETLNIMQRLYEHHKVITYPRTDSRYIGADIVPTLKERLAACNIGPYRKSVSYTHLDVYKRQHMHLPTAPSGARQTPRSGSHCSLIHRWYPDPGPTGNPPTAPDNNPHLTTFPAPSRVLSCLLYTSRCV